MKVSIITVSFNSELTIERTINSVLSQKDVDIEYIIIDGASTDSTFEIIKRYTLLNPKTIKSVSEKDNGIYDAMNKGIKLSTGDIIGILNSDDYYAHNSVLMNVHSVFKNKNSDACFGNILYIKNNKPYRLWKAGKARSFINGWMPPHPTLFIKKEIYDKYGYFSLDCGTAADYELMLRFFEKRNISSTWLNEIFVNMSIGGASNATFLSRIKAHKKDKYAWKKNNLKYNNHTVWFKKLRKIPQFILAKFYKGEQ